MEEWSRTSATSIRSDDACLTAHQAKMVGASVHVWDIFTNFRPTTRTVPLGFLQKTQMEVYMTSCDKHSSREGMCFINSPQDFGQGHIRDPPQKPRPRPTSTYLDLPRPTSTPGLFPPPSDRSCRCPRRLHLSSCAWLHRIASQQGRTRYAARIGRGTPGVRAECWEGDPAHVWREDILVICDTSVITKTWE